LLQVPANRIGFGVLQLSQLKILQEVITLTVFVPFAVFYMKQRLAELPVGGRVPDGSRLLHLPRLEDLEAEKAEKLSAYSARCASLVAEVFCASDEIAFRVHALRQGHVTGRRAALGVHRGVRLIVVWLISGPYFELQRHLAAGDQHLHHHHHLPDGVPHPEHAEPGCPRPCR
jgi:hypothetical protein